MSKVCPVCGTSYTDNNVFCPADGSTLRAAEMEGDLIGSVVADRYLVTDLLGEGGMGKVFLARHVRLPQQAAIKVLRPAMLRDPDAVARFNREAANASLIEHDRIARVFDYGETADGTVYLAMEYVPGRTLKAIVQETGAFTPSRTAEITRQVAEALDAAHRMGIVHRDLKPDNVMVIEDEATGDRCKVVDFGIAKAADSDKSEGGLTKTGFVVGTPEFMSPEQLVGGTLDHRSDVYSLALLSYQTLTGHLPFDSSTPERAMTARLVESPRVLAEVRPDVGWPSDLQACFDKGLARNPTDRYESAGAFARDLAASVIRWANGEVPAQAPPPPMPDPISFATTKVEKVQKPKPETGGNKGILLGGVALAAVAGLALVVKLFFLGGEESSVTEGDSSGGNAQVVATLPVPTQPDEGSDISAETEPATETPSPAVTQLPPSAPTPAPTPSRTINLPEARTSSPVLSESASIAAGTMARRALDSIRSALNPLTATAADARRGISALRTLMPRLRTAEDSAWAYLRQAEAHFIMEDERSACVALSAARPLVKTNGQRDVMSIMSGALSGDC